jgi:hypothetical protein
MERVESGSKQLAELRRAIGEHKIIAARCARTFFLDGGQDKPAAFRISLVLYLPVQDRG